MKKAAVGNGAAPVRSWKVRMPESTHRLPAYAALSSRSAWPYRIAWMSQASPRSRAALAKCLPVVLAWSPYWRRTPADLLRRDLSRHVGENSRRRGEEVHVLPD